MTKFIICNQEENKFLINEGREIFSVFKNASVKYLKEEYAQGVKDKLTNGQHFKIIPIED